MRRTTSFGRNIYRKTPKTSENSLTEKKEDIWDFLDEIREK
jgi:hypothetical protein